jgi:hypothetical protein
MSDSKTVSLAKNFPATVHAGDVMKAAECGPATVSNAVAGPNWGLPQSVSEVISREEVAEVLGGYVLMKRGIVARDQKANVTVTNVLDGIDEVTAAAIVSKEFFVQIDLSPCPSS